MRGKRGLPRSKKMTLVHAEAGVGTSKKLPGVRSFMRRRHADASRGSRGLR